MVAAEHIVLIIQPPPDFVVQRPSVVKALQASSVINEVGALEHILSIQIEPSQ